MSDDRYTSREFNAGQALNSHDLDETRAEAQLRANGIGLAVHVYQHVGGRPVHRPIVRARGDYMWRDSGVLTEAGIIAYGPPKFWALIETVEPTGTAAPL